MRAQLTERIFTGWLVVLALQRPSIAAFALVTVRNPSVKILVAAWMIFEMLIAAVAAFLSFPKSRWYTGHFPQTFWERSALFAAVVVSGLAYWFYVILARDR